jgi:hypothetical protein
MIRKTYQRPMTVCVSIKGNTILNNGSLYLDERGGHTVPQEEPAEEDALSRYHRPTVWDYTEEDEKEEDNYGF